MAALPRRLAVPGATASPSLMRSRRSASSTCLVPSLRDPLLAWRRGRANLRAGHLPGAGDPYRRDAAGPDGSCRTPCADTATSRPSHSRPAPGRSAVIGRLTRRPRRRAPPPPSPPRRPTPARAGRPAATARPARHLNAASPPPPLRPADRGARRARGGAAAGRPGAARHAHPHVRQRLGQRPGLGVARLPRPDRARDPGQADAPRGGAHPQPVRRRARGIGHLGWFRVDLHQGRARHRAQAPRRRPHPGLRGQPPALPGEDAAGAGLQLVERRRRRCWWPPSTAATTTRRASTRCWSTSWSRRSGRSTASPRRAPGSRTGAAST